MSKKVRQADRTLYAAAHVVKGVTGRRGGDPETCAGEPEVTVSALGDEAVAIGAVRPPLERATADLFPDGLPI